MKKMKQALKYGAIPSISLVTGSAFAAVPETLTSAATTLGTDGVSAISTVGGIMLTLAGVAVLFKWAKASFFG